MNPTEIIPGHRAVCVTDGTKEIVEIKGFTPEGLVRVRNSFGDASQIPCECITKLLG